MMCIKRIVCTLYIWFGNVTCLYIYIYIYIIREKMGHKYLKRIQKIRTIIRSDSINIKRPRTWCQPFTCNNAGKNIIYRCDNYPHMHHYDLSGGIQLLLQELKWLLHSRLLTLLPTKCKNSFVNVKIILIKISVLWSAWECSVLSEIQ